MDTGAECLVCHTDEALGLSAEQPCQQELLEMKDLKKVDLKEGGDGNKPSEPCTVCMCGANPSQGAGAGGSVISARGWAEALA